MPDSNDSGREWQTLRAKREAANYTTEDLAETCGLTKEEITAVEEGRDSDPGKITRMMAALRSAAKH